MGTLASAPGLSAMPTPGGSRRARADAGTTTCGTDRRERGSGASAGSGTGAGTPGVAQPPYGPGVGVHDRSAPKSGPAGPLVPFGSRPGAPPCLVSNSAEVNAGTNSE